MIRSRLVRPMFKFEELRVYKEAVMLVDQIYDLTKVWPKEELFGLTNQFRRAGTSIVLNIAEGSSRTRKEFRHFLDLSRGSCYECAAILAIARNRGYIQEDIYERFYEYCDKTARMINALKTALK